MQTTTESSAQSFQLERRGSRVQDTLLLNDTREVLAALPKGARPVQLPRAYPRIANELIAGWGCTSFLLEYLDGLLEDKRGSRRGFPAMVAEELRALRAHVMLRTDAPKPAAE